MAMSTTAHERANARKKRVLELLKQGHTIAQAVADPAVGVTLTAYRNWLNVDARFALEVKLIRQAKVDDDPASTRRLSHQAFRNRWLDGRNYAKFQLDFMRFVDEMPLGNIVLALWPPGHAKTGTMEHYMTENIVYDNQWCTAIAGENIIISRKILGAIRNRLEPTGPYPKMVKEFGPFKPQTGYGRDDTTVQPWSADVFNVHGKKSGDSRDYSFIALGAKSTIVSTRTDHLHLDDIQSTKTANETPRIENWVRQDALSRPGEHGKTTIVGTRVCEDDVYERLAEDQKMIEAGVLKVLKFPAISTGPDGKPQALWPERYNLEQLERMRAKVGEEAWDRNWMQNPSASKRNQTFTEEIIGPALNPLVSLHHRMTGDPIVYIGLDPAIGGMNCVMAVEVQAKRLIIRQIREAHQLTSNAEIMQQLGATVFDMNKSGQVTDVVVETMGFQKGLMRDPDLLRMQREMGFQARSHLTGLNKYDENIGIPSMVSSFMRGEIVLPWAEDDLTRHEIGELVRQLKAWKPLKRGNKLRQDRVMALWFVWTLWQNRWKRHTDGDRPTSFRTGVPWSGTKTDLIVPIGARL